LHECRGREQGVSVRGGTRPTPSVSDVAVAVSTSRKVAVLRVLSQQRALENVTLLLIKFRVCVIDLVLIGRWFQITGASRPLGERPLEREE